MAALVLLLLIAWDVRTGGPLSHLDRRVATRMGEWNLRGHTWTRLLLTVGLWFGQRGTVFVGSVILAGWLLVTRRTVKPAVCLVVALLSLFITVYLFKFGVARNAPIDDARGRPPGSGTSFPSGHAANAVALWGWAVLACRSQQVPPWLFGTLRWGRRVAPGAVFITMILLNYHWVSDLLAGLALGVTVLWLVERDVWSGLADRIDEATPLRAVLTRRR